ncbi:MAG: FAD-dependent oxidoreductase [Bacteroidetes bacterium]|nr:FAD-dependent oxidoreductase [Bacteroidota bacterium]
MSQIHKHPILSIPETEKIYFKFNGHTIEGDKGFTIAAALHRAGFPIHSHSLADRSRSLECGIGKCGACEMIVDGQVRRICITLCDSVKEVREIPKDFIPKNEARKDYCGSRVFKTRVVIIGAGPAGLAVREKLNELGIANIVVDSNDKIGGQFLMQTHQFFFFEKEKKFGGMRGFDIATTLAGDNHDGIFLNSTVWDIFEGNRMAVKNFLTGEIFYVDADYLVVAAGAVPFMPTFENDDLPGVYTAAVVQKMMNTELTLLGKNFLTVGAGNIGYLTSYQLKQAGANVKAIIEAQPFEGGFPVQANRVRRLGIPVILSHLIVKAIPNKKGDGISGAVVALSENFKPVPGSERIIDGIDAINICTGLVSDNALLLKGHEMFGRRCFGAGDAVRIGEGTSAVLRGTQVAYEIAEDMGVRNSYFDHLAISKEYIDSQQHPNLVIENPYQPEPERMSKPFVIIDCIYGFACNPCAFACPHGAITKSSTSAVPLIDYEKCIGCMDCVYQCPGLAIFGYNTAKKLVYLPVEFDVEPETAVFFVDNNGKKIGECKINRVLRKKNLTHIAVCGISTLYEGNEITAVRGFIAADTYPDPVVMKENTETYEFDDEMYVCHCDDVKLDEVMEVIGERKIISFDEIKHTTRLGMGPCRGKRCSLRLRQLLRPKGIHIIGDSTPRAPLSSQVFLDELYPSGQRELIFTNVKGTANKIVKVDSFVAGGGIAGSSAFRYLAEAGLEPVMINFGTGSSWRNIAGGRPAFSMPELSDIAAHNLEIFSALHAKRNIDFRQIEYVTFAHDEAMHKALENSLAWQDARMVCRDKFGDLISPYYNTNNQKYGAALVSKNCWQATPGKTIEAIREIGRSKGGTVIENCKMIDIYRNGKEYVILVQQGSEYTEFHAPVFVNALGADGGKYAEKLGVETGLFPVKHQAFITRRLPMLGINGNPLPMLIDRRRYKGFTAVYGQQLAETGQIIGCASPLVEPMETDKDVKFNSKAFAEIVSEVFIDWIPELSSAGFQALWAGYYIEPRMVIDPAEGLFIGLRGQGFMLGQYLGKLYVDKLTGKPVPAYFDELKLSGSGLAEKAFK